MLYALISTALGCISLAGWGILLRPGHPKKLQDLGKLILYGFFICGSFGLLLNFATPLLPAAAWVFYGLGFLFLILNLQKLAWHKLSIFWGGLFCIMFVVIVGLAVNTFFVYDSGLNHIQSVLWLQKKLFTFGLANIHSRFGMNSIWWVVSAILNPYLSPHYATDISNSILVIATCLVFLPENGRPAYNQLGVWFLASLFLVWGNTLLFDQLGSPATDLPVAFLWLLCIFIFFSEIINVEVVESERHQSYADLMIIVFLGIMVKPSSLPMLGSIPILFFLKDKSRALNLVKSLTTDCRGLIFLVISTFCLWLLRNFFLSGCWLFPSVLTCQPRMSWSSPQWEIVNIHSWIKSWARMPGVSPETVLKDSNWIFEWWQQFITRGDIRDTFKVFVLSVIFWITSFRHRNFDLMKRFFIPALWLLACGLFWFTMAPDIRFASGLFSSVAALLMYLGVVCASKSFRRVVLSYFILMSAICVGNNLKIAFLAAQNYPIKKVINSSEFSSVIKKISALKVEYWMPDPQARSDQCWFAELPCTPYAQDRLGQATLGPYVVYFQEPSRRNGANQ